MGRIRAMLALGNAEMVDRVLSKMQSASGFRGYR